MASIDQARREVESKFAESLAWIDTSEARTLAEAERGLWTRLLALGRALMTLFLFREVARPRAATYEQAGRVHVLTKKRAPPKSVR